MHCFRFFARTDRRAQCFGLKELNLHLRNDVRTAVYIYIYIYKSTVRLTSVGLAQARPNNIRLVCGKCKLEVTSTPPAKRPSHLPGFQQSTTALCITTALEASWALGRAIITASTARCDYGPIATRPLPEGCHEVECHGANRRKVIELLSLCFFAFSNGGYKAIGTLMFKH